MLTNLTLSAATDSGCLGCPSSLDPHLKEGACAQILVKVNATSVTPAISVTGSGPLTCSAAVNGQTVDTATGDDAVACSGLYDAATGAGASQGY